MTFLGRRQQHASCRVRALVDTTEGRGGLAVRLDENHHYDIEAGSGEVRVVARVGTLRTEVATARVPEGSVVLWIEAVASSGPFDPQRGPDMIKLGLGATALATLDGRYLSTEVAGGFTGRVIGVYAASGTVHVDWFDYEPLETAAQ